MKLYKKYLNEYAIILLPWGKISNNMRAINHSTCGRQRIHFIQKLCTNTIEATTQTKRKQYQMLKPAGGLLPRETSAWCAWRHRDIHLAFFAPEQKSRKNRANPTKTNRRELNLVIATYFEHGAKETASNPSQLFKLRESHHEQTSPERSPIPYATKENALIVKHGFLDECLRTALYLPPRQAGRARKD